MAESPHDASSLLETMLRFENSNQPDLINRWVAWPEMAAFINASVALRNESERFARNDAVEADHQRWTNARYLLRSSLISPSDPLLELADQSTWGALVDGELGILQETARRAAQQLAESSHRGLVALGAFFGPDPRLRWPAKGVARVIVPLRAVEATFAALKTLPVEGIDWEVCNLTEARRRSSCAVTVLLGAPEFHEGWRTEDALRPRVVGWLLNAPMSAHIISLRWAGSPRFESSKYEPYQESSVFDPRNWSDPIEENVVADDVVREQSSPRPRAATTHSFDAVEAIDFQLPDRRWISFGVEHGPKASRIDDDAEFDIGEVVSVRARALRRGNTLVILEADAAREVRRELCREWLASDPNRPSFAAAWATVVAYKSAVRKFLGTRTGITSLINKGISEEYVRSQYLRSSENSSAMAPQFEERFKIFAEAAGWTPPPDAWSHVEALRAGFIDAGRVLAQRLRKAVAQDLTWVELVDQQRIAQIEVEGVGQVTLAPILAIESETVLRSENDLGVIVRT